MDNWAFGGAKFFIVDSMTSMIATLLVIKLGRMEVYVMTLTYV
jgi:hypothetical protein